MFLTVSQKWLDETNWFFACWHEAKSYYDDFVGGGSQKWAWPLNSALSQQWIDKLSWVFAYS